MKKSIFKTIPVLTVVSMILVPGLLPSVQAAGCKSNDFRGNYGYSEQGTVNNFGAVVEVGVISADNQGNLTGNGVLNIFALGGGINVSLKGTYTLNSNCMGTATFETTDIDHKQSLGSKEYAFVLNQDEVRFISKVLGDSLVGVGRKVAAP